MVKCCTFAHIPPTPPSPSKHWYHHKETAKQEQQQTNPLLACVQISLCSEKIGEETSVNRHRESCSGIHSTGREKQKQN